MNNQDLQTIQEQSLEQNLSFKKDPSELSPNQRSRAISYFEYIIQSLEKNDLLELMFAIQSRLKQDKKPRIRRASSKQINEISLFSDKEELSEVNSPTIGQSTQREEHKYFDLFNQPKNLIDTEISRTRSAVLTSQFSTKSNLAEKRGTKMLINTTVRKRSSDILEGMSPSFKLDSSQRMKTSKIHKKNTLMMKFKSKIGVQTAERDIQVIKQVERELAFKPQNNSQSLFPIILGIIGLVIMLQVYLF